MKERELFLAALDIEDRAAQQAHLRAECGDDLALLARVEALLASHQGQSQFLNTPVVEQIADGAEAETAATMLVGNGSTHDDDDIQDEKVDLDETAAFKHNGPENMTKHNDDGSDDEIPLGYLEPPIKPNSLGRLGHYEVLEVVGRGAFGTVLRAFDEKLQRVVAIKVLAPEMAATSPARKRFLREARTSAAIRHENVVAIHAVEDDPIPYLVMEFIPGQTLQQRLENSGPLAVLEVLKIGKQIADGLAAAHAQDLIHRDIKPGNILLEGGVSERVKITDFGLARTADDASMTQSGLIAGTPMYMAPEQAMGHKLDQRADLFSFGSVLYQMLSGRPPFRAASTVAVLKRVVDDAPRPIQETIPEVPTWMCELISRLHAKSPDERIQTAKEVSDLLGRCLDDLKAGRVPKLPSPSPSSASTVEHSPVIVAKPDQLPRREALRRSPLAKVVTAVLVLLAVVGITEAIGVTRFTPTIIRIAFGSGILVIESDDPGMRIAIDGEEVTFLGGGGISEISLRPGKYKIAGLKDGQPVNQELVSITRNGRTIVQMSLEPNGVAATSLTKASSNITPTNLANADGWVPLFNGKDLTGWKTTDELPGKWTVTDGILTGSSQQSYLFSERADFANFHLRVEAKTNGLGGSGLHFRAPFVLRHGAKAVFTQPASGYEVDLFNQPAPIGTILEIVKGAPPRAMCLAANNSAYRAGEWFTLELIADGNRFITKINGQETVNSQDDASRYSAGHLAISVFDPRTVVQFRKIEIKELPPPPASDSGPQPRFFASNDWIDVVPLIDPQLDKWDMRLTDKNEWRMEQGELVGGGGDTKPHKMLLPLDADFFPSFECELDFTRRAGEQGFNLNFPNANGDTPLYFDTLGPRGVFVRHRRTGPIPLSNAPLIETGKRTNVRVEVRRQQVGDRITVWNGDTQVGTWTGDRNELISINNEGYEHRRRLSLWINAGNEFVFHRIRVRMLDGGNAETVRPVPSVASSTAPHLAIAPFDAAQARAHQEAWAKHLGVPVEYTNSVGMKFVLIPPGEFMMGSTPEQIEDTLKVYEEVTPKLKTKLDAMVSSAAPQHRVVLTQPIYLGIHEVTQRQFEQVLNRTPSAFSATGQYKELVAGIDTQQFPVEMVSWNDAAEFCTKLSERERMTRFDFQKYQFAVQRNGTGYRLPTEAEWEAACRAGTTTKYWVGDNVQDLAQSDWVDPNGDRRPHRVGELRANPFGLFDVHGNIQELVLDWWAPDYYSQFASSPAIDPLGPATPTPGTSRVTRGGRFAAGELAAQSSKRGVYPPTGSLHFLGFRVALSIDAVKAAKQQTPPAVTKQEPPPASFTNSIGMEFVIVPKGKSWLGGGKDKLGDREVAIPADFYLGKYEVTQEEWEKVMGQNPCHFSRTGGGKEAVMEISDADLKRFPVETVSWDECQLFVAKLNEREKETGWMYRLPSATEWEYACRGGPMTDKANSAFDFYFAKPTNNPLREQSSFGKNMGLNRTGKVGSNEANGLGIFDMHRNVWEWCDDKKEAADGNLQRAQMGGGWNHIRSRSAAANIESELPSHRSNALGLRLARVASGDPSPEVKTPKR